MFLQVTLTSLTLRKCTFLKKFSKNAANLPYWCFVQQETTTYRLQKLELLYSKFNLDINKLNLTFWKRQEVDKKWPKPKQSTEPHIFCIPQSTVHSRVKTPRLILTEGLSIIFWFYLSFYCKKTVNKSVSQSNFNFINP